MSHCNKICVRQILKSLRNARFLHVLFACSVGVSSILTPFSLALADERERPLQIQIPSVPARNPSVDIVDNNLSVHLLDAQVESVRHAQPPPQAPPNPAPVASGQFVLGSAPDASSIKRRKKKISSHSPAVVMTGAGRALPNQPFVSPSQSSASAAPQSPQNTVYSAPPLPYAAATHQAGAASGSSRKSFLSHFALEQPRFLSSAEMPRDAEVQPAASAYTAPIVATQRPRVTAVLPEQAQPMAGAIPKKPKPMKKSADVKVQNAGVSAEELENSERLARLSSSLAETTESLSRSLNALTALTNAAVMDAAKHIPAETVHTANEIPEQPQPYAEEVMAEASEEDIVEVAAQQQPHTLPVLSNSAHVTPNIQQAALQPAVAPQVENPQPIAAAQVMSNEQNVAMAPPQQLKRLPSLEEAKQAFANSSNVNAQGNQYTSDQVLTEAQPFAVARHAMIDLGNAPSIAAPAVAQAKHIPEVEAPQVMSVPRSQIAQLPTLEEAKQAFASQDPLDSSGAIATRKALASAVEVTEYGIDSLSDIEPAAGAESMPTNASTAPVSLVRSELVLEEVDGAAVDLTPVRKTAKSEALSAESEAMLNRVPTKIDTPRNVKQERLDIERERTTASVFSEVSGSVEGQDEKPLELTIDVERPSLDVNYELNRAYTALASGQTEIARESYLRVLGIEPNNIQALFGMGALLHRSGDFDTARRYYSKVLAQDPDNRDTLNNFLSLVAEEAPEQALAKLKELESKNPDFSPIPAQISFIYQKLQNIQLAGQYMVKALSLAPNNLTYKYNLAILLDKQGARSDAAGFYQDLVDAYLRGESIPGNIASIQERLTFIRSNR